MGNFMGSQQLVGSVVYTVSPSFNLHYYYEVTAVSTKGTVVVSYLGYKSLIDNVFRSALSHNQEELLMPPDELNYITQSDLEKVAKEFPHLDKSLHVSHT